MLGLARLPPLGKQVVINPVVSSTQRLEGNILGGNLGLNSIPYV